MYFALPVSVTVNPTVIQSINEFLSQLCTLAQGIRGNTGYP